MYQLQVDTDLALRHEKDNEAMNRLIHASLRRKKAVVEHSQKSVFWGETEFGLGFSSLFSRLNETLQHNILRSCNEVLLSDFYFLEKSGLAYCAKMILLGESTEIRQMFGLIACDEATHLEWFTPYVKVEKRTRPQGKLLPVLGQIIADCDANSLFYLAQTIIEGWGFVTYQALAKTCQCPVFSHILRNIMKDEALHHKTGSAMFDIAKIDHTAATLIVDRMLCYADVLRAGPHTIIQCIEREVGELNFSELELLFIELKTQASARRDLMLLKHLMLQPGMENYVQKIQEKGFFKPYTPSQCAKIYQETRGLEQYTT